jgi:RNA polymerase subunit RPABC4/transcription elongation factor Spt4
MTTVPKACPFCGSRDTVKEADFGTSLMVNRQHCRHCHSFFEAIKWGDRSEDLDLPPFLRGEPRSRE